MTTDDDLQAMTYAELWLAEMGPAVPGTVRGFAAPWHRRRNELDGPAPDPNHRRPRG